ncbi:endonuclease V, partial [Clostridium botulinum]|nr:endonuclease V [Clostridium botulinum]
MKIDFIHDFNVKTEEEFSKIQLDFADKIVLENRFNIKNIKTCAGVDL